MSAPLLRRALKADEMLPAVETALQRLGSEIGPDEREKISGLVRQVLEARESGSLSDLRTALNELGEDYRAVGRAAC